MYMQNSSHLNYVVSDLHIIVQSYSFQDSGCWSQIE